MAPLDDKLTPLTHGCSPVGSRTGGASIKLTNTWPQSRSGSCAAGAPKKPPLGRRVLSDRARIQRLARERAQPDGTTRETPSSDGARPWNPRLYPADPRRGALFASGGSGTGGVFGVWRTKCPEFPL